MDCPTEDHVHCDVCHGVIRLNGEDPIFVTDGTKDGPVTIYCEADAKKYAEAHDIMFTD